MHTIGLAMPSRNRPDRAKFAIGTALAAAAHSSRVFVVLAVDADDGALPLYERMVLEFGGNVSLLVGDFNTSVKGWNAAAAALRAQGCASIHMAADDLEYFKDWDKHVEAVFETCGPYVILHYFDEYRNQDRACNPFVSAAYYDNFGFLPPEISHFGSDEWLEAMGRLSGCLVYSRSLHIRHNHPKEGRASWDETYLNPRTPKRRAADAEAWEGLQEKLRHESARLLRETKPSFRSVPECGSQRSPSPSPLAPVPPPQKPA